MALGEGAWDGDNETPPPARGPGERCKLLSGVRGGAPTANAFGADLQPRKCSYILTLNK